MADSNLPKHYLIIFNFLLLVLFLFPLLLVTFPPYLDYYSHISRVFIVSRIELFSDFYSVNPVIPPNIAMDAIIGVLIQFLPWQLSGWIFLVTVLLIQVSGAIFLNRRLMGHQVCYAGPLTASVFLYNYVLSMGFINFLFGLGLMLWILGIWLSIRERGWLVAVGLGAVAAILLLYAHVIAFGLYAIVVATYELQPVLLDYYRKRQVHFNCLFKGALTFIPAIALCGLLFTDSSSGGPEWIELYQPYLKHKLRIIGYTFDSSKSLFSLGSLGAVAIGAMGLASGTLRIAKSMILPLAALIVFFLGAPTRGYHFDDRLPAVILLLGLASMRIDFVKKFKYVPFMLVLLGLLVLRNGNFALDYFRFDKEVDRAVAAFSDIKAGSVVAVVADITSPNYGWSPYHRRFWHVASVAATEAPVFVTTTHAQPNQHTIVVNQAYKKLHNIQRGLPWPVSNAAEVEHRVSQLQSLVAAAERRSKKRPSDIYLFVLSPFELTNVIAGYGTILAKSESFMLVRLKRGE